MTIAKRLVLLLAVPLLALVGLGVFTRLQLTTIETRSRFVADLQIPSLATLGNISRTFAELRVLVRNHVLATSEAERVSVRSTFERDEAELGRLLDQYERSLISDDRDRRLLNDYRNRYREWLDRVKQVMSLSAAGRREEASEMLRGTALQDLGERMSSASAEWIRLNEDLAHAASRTVVDSITAARWRILAANAAAIVLTGLLGFFTFLRIVKPIQALDASVSAIAAGEYGKEVPFTSATDETGGLARSVDVLKQGAAAMDEQRWVKANVSRVTGALQGAASLAEFGQRLLSDLVPMLGGGAAGFYVLDEAHAELQRVATYGMADVSDLPTIIRLGAGLVGQCAQERRTLALANLPPDYLRISSGLGQAAPVQATAMPAMSTDTLLGVLEVASFRPLTAREQTLLDELLPVVAHEPGGPAAQPSDRGAARADPGAGASTRDPGVGARRCQAQGRRSHRDEVDVPREHEPRDPHADERHHRPVASGAQDVALPEAARLREQGPQRRHVAARRDQRHPRLLEDRGRPARYRDHGLQAGRGDRLGHDADGAEGPRQGPRVPGARRARHPGTSARRSAASRADPDEPRQQRREVHRARRDSARHRAGGAHRREGATQVLRARHRESA